MRRRRTSPFQRASLLGGPQASRTRQRRAPPAPQQTGAPPRRVVTPCPSSCVLAPGRAGGLLRRADWQQAAPAKHLRVFAHTDAFSTPPSALVSDQARVWSAGAAWTWSRVQQVSRSRQSDQSDSGTDQEQYARGRPGSSSEAASPLAGQLGGGLKPGAGWPAEGDPKGARHAVWQAHDLSSAAGTGSWVFGWSQQHQCVQLSGSRP